jgi:hypothetical protein
VSPASRVWFVPTASDLGRALICCLAGAAFSVIAAVVSYECRPGLDVAFDRPDRPPPTFVKGLYGLERTPTGTAFAWTSGAVAIDADGLDRRIPWRLVLGVARGFRPVPDGPRLAVIAENRVLQEIQPGDQFAETVVDIPAAPDRRGIRLVLAVAPTFVPGSGDTRELGVILNALRLEPAVRWVWPPSHLLGWSAAIGGLLGFTLGLVSSLPFAIAGTFLCAVSYAALAAHSQAGSTYASMTAWHAALATAGFILLARPLVGLQPALRPAVGMALVVTAVFLFTKLLLVFHPWMTVGDSIFHRNRLQLVLRGNYFFTSAAPGGAFPYPVAFYVVTNTLASWMGNWVAAMRGLTSLTDASAGLAVFVAAGVGWRSSRAGLMALSFYHLTPAGFQVLAIAYLSNAFGQSLATVAACLVPLLSRRVMSISVAGLTAITTLAFLSHVSSFILLAVTLALALVLFAASRASETRRLAVPLAAALTVASVLSAGLYYRHFTDTYAQVFARARASPAGSTSAAAAPPVQRAEAHQTHWVPGSTALRHRVAAIPGYVSKYLGWPLVGLALLGWIFRTRDPAGEPLSRLLAAWVGTCLAFLVIGQLTSLDLRYYLAVFPALAILAARTIDLAWSRGGVYAGAAALALAWIATSGVSYWLAWFNPILPR